MTTTVTEVEPRPGLVGSVAAATRSQRLAERHPASDALVEEMGEEDRRFADSLAEIRRAAKLTQSAVALGMDWSQGTLDRIERRTATS